MNTNIDPEDLHYDHSPTELYDEEIKRVIPGWEALHQCIEHLLRREPLGAHILELGVGTGLTAQRVLQTLPRTQYSAIDFSEQMLAGARERLRPYNVTYINGDYAEIALPQNNLVVSVIGMHHQGSDTAKQRMFQRIYDSTEGGFVFGDLFTYRDRLETERSQRLHYQFLEDHARDRTTLEAWVHHQRNLNVLANLEDQVQWLKEVGFREVSVLFRMYLTALVYAKR